MIDLEKVARERQEMQMSMPKSYFIAGNCIECGKQLPPQSRSAACLPCREKELSEGKARLLRMKKQMCNPNRVCSQPGCDMNLAWVNKSGVCHYHQRYPNRVGPPR